MPRLSFRRFTRRHATPGTTLRFRMMNLAGGDAAPANSGWYESSEDLARGLVVIEGAPGEAFDALLEPAQA